MKMLRMPAILLALFAMAPPLDAAELDTQQQRQSYAIGVQTGMNFKKDAIEVDPELMLQGLKDGMSGGQLLIPQQQIHSIMAQLQTEVRDKMIQSRRIAAVENQGKSAAFFAQNKTRDGVVTLPSGLQYQVLKAGSGDKPSGLETVQCYYRGTLLDGTEFDATEPGKPAKLKVSQLIAGWKEALQLMSAGSKWKLYIPPQLAYGERGAGNEIGPNQALVFEVELLAAK